MQPRVPTSVLLAQLLKELPPEHVCLAWLIGRLEQRSFGLLILILGLLGLVPGIATFTGLLLAFPAAQMMLGRESVTLPGFLAARSIPARHFGRWTARTIPLFERMETLIRPRLQTPFQATKRAVGLVVLLLTATAAIRPSSVQPHHPDVCDHPGRICLSRGGWGSALYFSCGRTSIAFHLGNNCLGSHASDRFDRGTMERQLGLPLIEKRAPLAGRPIEILRHLFRLGGDWQPHRER